MFKNARVYIGRKQGTIVDVRSGTLIVRLKGDNSPEAQRLTFLETGRIRTTKTPHEQSMDASHR